MIRKTGVQSLQHEILDLQQRRDTAQKTLTEMIEGLELEATGRERGDVEYGL